MEKEQSLGVDTKHGRFDYPKDKETMVIKIIIILLLSSLVFYAAFVYYPKGMDIGFFSLLFLGGAGYMDAAVRLHRLRSYDEICTDGYYLIIRKKGTVLSKVPLDSVYTIKKTNAIDFFQIIWVRIYSSDDKLLFHYNSNEIDEEDEKKMIKLIGNGEDANG